MNNSDYIYWFYEFPNTGGIETFWDSETRYLQKKQFAKSNNITLYPLDIHYDNYFAPSQRFAHPHDEDNGYGWFDRNWDALNIWSGFLNRDLPNRFAMETLRPHKPLKERVSSSIDLMEQRVTAFISGKPIP